jgi:hypothetical protein
MYLKSLLISIMMTTLLYSGGYYCTNNQIEIVEEPEVVHGTFEELVTNKYLERARSIDLDKIYMTRADGKSLSVSKSSSDQETVYKVLDYFNELNLFVYSPNSSNSSVNDEINYHIQFKNTHEFEKIDISASGDNTLHTYIVFHLISEDKEKKIISHKRDYVFEYYTIDDGTIDFDYLDEIFESIEEEN